jgi:hypothetical protein
MDWLLYGPAKRPRLSPEHQAALLAAEGGVIVQRRDGSTVRCETLEEAEREMDWEDNQCR